jgi:hypothetical protein
MVNTICDKLNTTIEKGCNLKLFEYHQNEMVCINDNSIILNINNMINERFINIGLKIVLKSPLEYYLIDEDKKQSYELKSINVLKYVLDKLCDVEKRKCGKESCISVVDIKKDFPNSYGLCNDKSEYMLSTAHGYRNKSSSSTKYFFCSKECMDYFDKYKRCNRCHEDGTGTFIEELGYTLCNGRDDYNPPCIVKYHLEKRFENDYKNNEINDKLKNGLLRDCDELRKIITNNDNKLTNSMLLDLNYLRQFYELRNNRFYEIDDKLKNGLLRDCDELKQIITNNDNKLTNSMLFDLNYLYEFCELRNREEFEPSDKKTFEELCESIKEELF